MGDSFTFRTQGYVIVKGFLSKDEVVESIGELNRLDLSILTQERWGNGERIRHRVVYDNFPTAFGRIDAKVKEITGDDRLKILTTSAYTVQARTLPEGMVFHKDTTLLKRDLVWTAIVYLTDVPTQEHGATVIRQKDGTPFTVLCEPGDLLIFDGSIDHKGTRVMPPNSPRKVLNAFYIPSG